MKEAMNSQKRVAVTKRASNRFLKIVESNQNTPLIIRRCKFISMGTFLNEIFLAFIVGYIKEKKNKIFELKA